MVNVIAVEEWLKEGKELENQCLDRVPRRIVKALEKYVNENGLTVQDFINEALEKALIDKGAL